MVITPCGFFLPVDLFNNQYFLGTGSQMLEVFAFLLMEFNGDRKPYHRAKGSVHPLINAYSLASVVQKENK